MLIALCGFKRSGKDTIARVLVEDCGYTRVAFADAIRAELAAEGVTQPPDDEKEVPGPDGESYRDKLIARGEVRRAVDPDHWVKALAPVLDTLPLDADVVISDCRRQNEMEWVRRRGGLLVWISREGVTSNGHDTEQDNSAGCDLTLVNDAPPPRGYVLDFLFAAQRDDEPVTDKRSAAR